MPDHGKFLSWLHIGDLHITRAGAANHRDLLRIAALIRGLAPGSIDFVVLPGDNADDGTAEQFALVRDALAGLPVTLHILPGDHDVAPGTLDGFHTVLGAERLPKAVTVGGHRCLFLDVVSAGGGGLDFRLEDAQLAWAEGEADQAARAGQAVAVFMHTYPADLQAGAGRLRALLARPDIVCVDMGHTHYNELANDGGTIFMATRSTGQIEEGAVGVSFAAIDGGVVSWRFKPLDDPWPLVMITSPADHRLITAPGSPDQVVRGSVRIAAKIWGVSEPVDVYGSVDGHAEFPLQRDGRSALLWHGFRNEALDDGHHRLTVRVEGGGAAASETIIFLVSRDGRYAGPPRIGDGSDQDRIGAWPEKHILGTQLGPNRNGRAW